MLAHRRRQWANFNPSSANPDRIHYLHCLSAHYYQLSIMSKLKRHINQQDFKIYDLHFVKSEYFSRT